MNGKPGDMAGMWGIGGAAPGNGGIGGTDGNPGHIAGLLPCGGCLDMPCRRVDDCDPCLGLLPASVNSTLSVCKSTQTCIQLIVIYEMMLLYEFITNDIG